MQYRFDIPAIIEAISERTKIIWLCSPNNPTGTIVTRSEMQTLLDAAPTTTAVVVDQAYCEFVDDPDYADPLEFLAAGHRNVIALRSFSKAYALAGIRLGYAVADPVVCRMLDRISEPFLLSRPACAAGLAALADEDWLRASSAAVREGRDYLSRELAAVGWDVVPSQGNFVLADTHRDGRVLFRCAPQERRHRAADRRLGVPDTHPRLRRPARAEPTLPRGAARLPRRHERSRLTHGHVPG